MQLADKLAPYCGDDSLALPGARGLAVGAVTRFSVTLAGGDEVLAGRGHVVSVKGGAPDGAGSTVRVKVLEMQDACRPFWTQLLLRKRPASRVPAPPPPAGSAAPGPRPPTSLPVLEPSEHVFTALVRETFFGDDTTNTLSVEPGHDDPTVLAPPLAEAPQLALPVRLAQGPTRTAAKSPAYTGKTSGYTGKVMVARKSAWPPWAQAIHKSLAGFGSRLWQTVPQDARPKVALFGPWAMFWVLGVLCGLWWFPAKRTPTTVVSGVASVSRPAVESPALAMPLPRVRPLHDHCSVKLATQPEGAFVSWGELPLGDTPLENVAVPCGRALVSFRLAGYAPVVITMTATMDGPVVFSQTLKRPDVQLTIATQPSGAAAFINGSPAGSTPANVFVPEGEAFELRLEKSGYPPITKQMRVEGSQRSYQFKFVAADAGAAKTKRRRKP